MTHPTDALRLVPHEKVRELAMQLARSIAGLGYPVGLGVAPPEDVCMKAAQGIFDLYLTAAPASPLPRGGWRTDFENAPDCEEGILIVDATKISPAVGTARFVEGEWRGYNHGYGVECLWPSPTHWMPLPAAPTGDA